MLSFIATTQPRSQRAPAGAEQQCGTGAKGPLVHPPSPDHTRQIRTVLGSAAAAVPSCPRADLPCWTPRPNAPVRPCPLFPRPYLAQHPTYQGSYTTVGRDGQHCRRSTASTTRTAPGVPWTKGLGGQCRGSGSPPSKLTDLPPFPLLSRPSPFCLGRLKPQVRTHHTLFTL